MAHAGWSILFACIFTLSPFAGSAAAESGRSVLLTWDLTAADNRRLTIVVESTDPKKSVPPVTGPSAYNFVVEPADRVVIELKWAGDDKRGEIDYAVTGTDIDRKDLEALKKLITGAAPAGSEEKVRKMRGTAPRTVTKAVSDDLTPGGRLTVTFTLKERKGNGNEETEVTSYTSGGVSFRIKPRSPRVTVSAGLAVTTAPEPAVAIVKTAKLLTFEKGGNTQQAYEQMIALRDADTELQPIQTAVSFANFRLWERTYATLGVQLNQKVFEEPILGVTYRHPLAGTMGANFTAGIHFSHEIRILEGSGFSNGMRLDPSVGLTAEDVPTEERYHRRFVLAFSIDF